MEEGRRIEEREGGKQNGKPNAPLLQKNVLLLKADILTCWRGKGVRGVEAENGKQREKEERGGGGEREG